MTIRPPTDGGLLPRAAAHIAGAIILVWCAATAQAGNGLNLIGFGAESIGMGGGRAVFDLGAIGLGKVAYRNITMKGLRQPQWRL